MDGLVEVSALLLHLVEDLPQGRLVGDLDGLLPDAEGSFAHERRWGHVKRGRARHDDGTLLLGHADVDMRGLAVAAHGLALLVIEGGMGRVEGELGAPKRAIACLKDANEQGTNI